MWLQIKAISSIVRILIDAIRFRRPNVKVGGAALIYFSAAWFCFWLRGSSVVAGKYRVQSGI